MVVELFAMVSALIQQPFRPELTATDGPLKPAITTSEPAIIRIDLHPKYEAGEDLNDEVPQ